MTGAKLEMTNKTYGEMLINHLTCQQGWNYGRQWVDGCLFTLTPVLKRIYKDTPVEAKECTIKRHLELSNTHATLAPLLFGLVVALEVDTSEGEKGSIISIKIRPMGPIVGPGDGLPRFTPWPICMSIGVTMAVTGNIFGAIFTFVVFNILSQGMKWLGFRIGYTKGTEIINSGPGDEVVKKTSGAATVLGLRVARCLVSTTVKVNVPLVFASGEGKIVVQELIDKIMPCFLPVLVTALCHRRSKKTNGKEAVLLTFGIMIIFIGSTYSGVLGWDLQEVSAHYDHDIVPLRFRNILKRGSVNEPQVRIIR